MKALKMDNDDFKTMLEKELKQLYESENSCGSKSDDVTKRDRGTDQDDS